MKVLAIPDGSYFLRLMAPTICLYSEATAGGDKAPEKISPPGQSSAVGQARPHTHVRHTSHPSVT